MAEAKEEVDSGLTLTEIRVRITELCSEILCSGHVDSLQPFACEHAWQAIAFLHLAEGALKLAELHEARELTGRKTRALP